MKTMAFGEVQGCLMLVHGPDSPSDEEWSAWLVALSRYAEKMRRVRLLVFTEGGSPSPKQRTSMDSLAKRHQSYTKVAVMTKSTFVRGVS